MCCRGMEQLYYLLKIHCGTLCRSENGVLTTDITQLQESGRYDYLWNMVFCVVLGYIYFGIHTCPYTNYFLLTGMGL